MNIIGENAGWRSYGVLALSWAFSVLALFVFSIFVWPFDSWERDDRLALFQTATGLAGFGAGAVAIAFAGRQLETTFGSAKFSIDAEREPLQLRVESAANASGRIHLAVMKSGRAVPAAFRIQVVVHDYVKIVGSSLDDAYINSGDNICYLVAFSRLPLFDGDRFPVWVDLATNDDRLKPPPPSEPLETAFLSRVQVSIRAAQGGGNAEFHLVAETSATVAAQFDPPPPSPIRHRVHAGPWADLAKMVERTDLPPRSRT